MVSSTETGEFSGGVRVRGGRDDPAAPPREGEERRGLWFPRRKPGIFWGCFGGKGNTSSVAAGVSFLRTESVLRPVPVFRSAYLYETVHWTISYKTLDLQGFAPPIALKGKPWGGDGLCYEKD